MRRNQPRKSSGLRRPDSIKTTEFYKVMWQRMNQLISYLTFNGNCREAMLFYQHCLGGELHLQTLGDVPVAEKLPPDFRHYILHASLVKDDLVLMGTDMVGDDGLVKGNAVSILLECKSREEMESCFGSLSKGGKATHAIEQTHWGALFGGLTDPFGYHWLLKYSSNHK